MISEAAFEKLEDYRAFRHLFRHLYTHHIDPSRVFRIMEDLAGTWDTAREDLGRFIIFLESVS